MMIIDVRRPLPPDYPMPSDPARSNELDKGKPGAWLVVWFLLAVIGWSALGFNAWQMWVAS